MWEERDDIEKNRGRSRRGMGSGARLHRGVGGFMEFDSRRGFSTKNRPHGVLSWHSKSDYFEFHGRFFIKIEIAKICKK